MATFLSNIFKRKPKTEEERLFHEFRKTEKKARALSNEIRQWKKSQANLCKGQKKMSMTLRKIAKIGVEPTLLIKQIDSLTAIRHQMLNEVQLTTQDSLQRLHSLFNNMHLATKKRVQAKSEVDQIKKKVDKYYSQYPIPIEKYTNAVKLHKQAVEKHKQTHENLLTDLQTISRGKNEFFKPCLEALLLTQMSCYHRIWNTIQPVIHEREKSGRLTTLSHMETIRGLVSVSGPEMDLKKKLATLRAKRSSNKSPVTPPSIPDYTVPDGNRNSRNLASGRPAPQPPSRSG